SSTMRAVAHINVATVSNKGIRKGVTAACSVTEVIDFCRFIGGFAPASERKNPRILTYMAFFYQPRALHWTNHRSSAEQAKNIAHFLHSLFAIADKVVKDNAVGWQLL
ncbi:MAG TPA: hypothetical protein VLE50_02020, partial [Cellvibrio sp.]|nr:hypothetical protein [Cellvibrio sp.]